MTGLKKILTRASRLSVITSMDRPPMVFEMFMIRVHDHDSHGYIAHGNIPILTAIGASSKYGFRRRPASGNNLT